MSPGSHTALLVMDIQNGIVELSTAIHPAVAPQTGDVVVTKRRFGAFSGSDLDVVLRSLEVTSLVLTGISTSGVVLSTLRAAADMDFEITVLSDCCSDSAVDIYSRPVYATMPGILL